MCPCGICNPILQIMGKMTPFHINTFFLEQYCNFRLPYLLDFLFFISPDMDPIWVKKKSPIIS